MIYILKYDGVPMGSELLQFIAQVVNNSGVCPSGKISMTQHDEELNIPVAENPIKAAIIVIGQKFATQLTGPGKNDTMFAVGLWNAVQTENDNVVRKAVHILATYPLSEFVHLANSYGLGNPELDAIRSINQYNPYNP